MTLKLTTFLTACLNPLGCVKELILYVNADVRLSFCCAFVIPSVVWHSLL